MEQVDNHRSTEAIRSLRCRIRLGHPTKMFRFSSPDRRIFFFRKVKEKKKIPDSLVKEASTYFNLQAHDLALLTTIGMM